MRQLAALRETVDTWEASHQRARALLDLVQLALDENNISLQDTFKEELNTLESELGRLEFQLVFTDPYDDRTAILGIHAGAGGTESQDWAQMLLRMYLRWAENRGYKTQVLETSPGEGAGVKSVLIEVSGG